jgi:hypothetical protein
MRRVLGIIVCTISFFGLAYGTNVPGGTIGVNTIWDLAGSPWIIQGNVVVSAGVTLTVNSGVQVKFDGLYSLTLNGNLASNGAAGSHVTFTTNNVSPAAGQWRNLVFNAGTASNLTYTDVRYGGYSNSNMVELNGGFVSISNSAFTNSQNYGIAMQGGSANIATSTISGCGWSFYMNSYAGTVSFGAGNIFTGNAHDGVYYNVPVNFTGNDTLYYPGIPYYLASQISVQNGATLTIAQGNILKFPNGGYLHVYGTLLAVGGSTDPTRIYFTDYRDDVWGGDTNCHRSGGKLVVRNQLLQRFFILIARGQLQDSLHRLRRWSQHWPVWWLRQRIQLRTEDQTQCHVHELLWDPLGRSGYGCGSRFQ